MTELDPLSMTLQLLGGLALFLYGMEKMTDGLKAAAGQQMNTLLARLTGNRYLGAITGAIVTAVIQSSSVTTVLVVGFRERRADDAGAVGRGDLRRQCGHHGDGADRRLQHDRPGLSADRHRLCHDLRLEAGRRPPLRRMLLGLGLIFYGMAVMGAAMSPLRTHEGFAALLQSLQNPFLGMLAGAVFTALVQSSSATIGLAVVMATQGLLSLPAGIAILFGAKIGTGITAVLAAIGKPLDAQRAAAVHVLFNVLGALIWLPFIPSWPTWPYWFRRWRNICRASSGWPRRCRARSPTPQPSGRRPTP
jgi:phosphate:Na+ symporter